MPVLPQKTEAESVAALHGAPYMICHIIDSSCCFSHISLLGCCMRVA